MSDTNAFTPRFAEMLRRAWRRIRTVRKVIRAAWFIIKAASAEDRGDFAAGIDLLDKAGRIGPLPVEYRARRALLLLRVQRLAEAQAALAALRKELDGSVDPNRQYLRRWCTATLGLMGLHPAQFDREAREALSIPCRQSLRRRFPLPIPDRD